jgi:RNA polymerase sigma factor (sigma-70 family)
MSELEMGYFEDDGEAVEKAPLHRVPATESDMARIALLNVDESVEESADALQDDEPTEVLQVLLTDDPVKDYLRSIGRTPLLNAVQEVELGTAIEVGLMAGKKIEELSLEDPNFIRTPYMRELRQIQQEGKRAFDQLVTANLRLVVHHAKRYQGKGMDFLELIQEGNAGLIRAAEKFDYQKGFKFSTYSTWWIRQSMSRALADQGRTIRIPVHQVEIMNKIIRTRSDMEVTLGRYPTSEEIATELEIPAQKVDELLLYHRTPLSLNARIGDDQDIEVGDLIADEQGLDPGATSEVNDMNVATNALLNELSDLEADIVRRHYGLEGRTIETLDVIGESKGLSRERIRQIEMRAIKKLRLHKTTDPAKVSLREYLT